MHKTPLLNRLAPSREILVALLGPIIIIVSAVFMIFVSWAKWPDILIDFGRELYVPWMLSNGHVLYTDIAYFNGPLSPYFNTLLFKIFGVSLMTLAVANIVLIAFLAFLMYRIISVCTGRLAAIMSGVVFMLIFAFPQYMYNGSYNYVAPYSHEITHGLVLAFSSIFVVRRYALTRNIWWAASSGLLLGLSFLTKPEIFISTFITVVSGFGLIYWKLVQLRKSWRRSILSFSAGMAIPVLAASVMLGIDKVFTPLGAIFNSDVAKIHFYREIMGLDFPYENLKTMFEWFLPLTILVILGWQANKKLSGIKKKYFLPVGALFALGTMLIYLFKGGSVLNDIARILPATTAVCLVYYLFKLKYSDEPKTSIKYAVMIMFCILSGSLLAKILLSARIWHYGFALAMPAMLLAIATLTGGFEMSSMDRKSVFPWIGFGFSLMLILVFLPVSVKTYATRTLPIEANGDKILCDEGYKGYRAKAFLEVIQDITSRDDRVLILPEGIMLNYLSRRQAPTRHINYMPPEFAIFGEDEMLRELTQSSPDLVIIWKKDLSDYGKVRFGQEGFGKDILSWITGNYRQLNPYSQLATYSSNNKRLILEDINVYVPIEDNN